MLQKHYQWSVSLVSAVWSGLIRIRYYAPFAPLPEKKMLTHSYLIVFLWWFTVARISSQPCHPWTLSPSSPWPLTGHYGGNCFPYLDLTLSPLQYLPSGSLYRCAELMPNRVELLDQAMVVMKEVLLINIIRQHTKTTMEQTDHINRGQAPALLDSSCKQDSPVLVRRVLKPRCYNSIRGGGRVQGFWINVESTLLYVSIYTIYILTIYTQNGQLIKYDL